MDDALLKGIGFGLLWNLASLWCLVRLLRSYNAGAEAFRKASESHERHTS